MTGTLQLYDGSSVTLPVLLAYELDYGAGVPCDSFWVKFLWAAGWTIPLHKAVTFIAEEDGERVFTGVVDEYTLSQQADGALIEISGRGMAARLLDNEAVQADYLTATTAVILSDHVTPYGITVADAGQLSAVPLFSVGSGSSEWNVLYTFARYYNGVTPRFDRMGQLILSPFADGLPKVLDETTPVTSLRLTEKRYGVLSSALLRYRSTSTVATVTDPDFLAEGGCARQVITVPNATTYRSMCYSGQYQLDSSKKERYLIQVTIPLSFWGWPGELVTLDRDLDDWDGTWRIFESKLCLDDQGARTVLVLGRPDAII